MNDIAAFLAIFAAWAALHSLSMSRSCKRLAARLLGARFAFYRLGFTALSLASFALALAAAPRLPQPLYQLHGPAAWAMWAVRLSAALFFAWTFGAFELLEFTGLRQARRYPRGEIGPDGESKTSERLAITGPYRIVRHPMYLAATAWLFADPDMTLEKLLFAAFAAAYFHVGSVFEERRLAAVFGQAYRDYQRTTPRLIPRLARGAGPGPARGSAPGPRRGG
ncbi:MAG: isoprenylcysteine carboxylmethyltransferase family protein [Desulfovibrionaceae bacterium]|nr:isoprenylcysteine carboxylmethyltransferase family protein [Desulfovibrionaceae bacterium]MBF0514596.1 isoprenylcysteine carboxylmethyltransferase family protein [Desulfovibrionaceae bacterium]